MAHSPSQRISLLRVFEDQHQLIVYTVDFILDTPDEWSKSIGDVVDGCARDPIGRDGDVILEMRLRRFAGRATHGNGTANRSIDRQHSFHTQI